MGEVSAVPMVRTSERTAFKRCRWAWDREFNDRMKPMQTAPPLRFGSLMHKALEKFYRPGRKRGPKPAITFKKIFDKDVDEQGKLGFRDEDGVWSDAGEMGVDLLEGYFEEYGADERYEVLVTEHPFQVPILDSRGKRVATYTGILDGVWRDVEEDRKQVVDHKSTASISTAHLALDEQAGAYWTFGVEALIAAGLLDDDLDGMLFNFLRKAKADPRPRDNFGHYLNKPTKGVLQEECLARGLNSRGTVDELIERIGPAALQLGEVSASQPPPRFHREPVWRDEVDRARVRERTLQEIREHRLVRAGKLDAYKNPGPFTCAGCGYRDICELHETGNDWEEMARLTMATWNPYDAHEIYDAERRG
jgi:hypothetical protein